METKFRIWCLDSGEQVSWYSDKNDLILTKYSQLNENLGLVNVFNQAYGLRLRLRAWFTDLGTFSLLSLVQSPNGEVSYLQ